MQVFAVFAIHDQKRVRLGLSKHYENNHYDAGQGAFFVATRGETTRQIATKLGMGDASESRQDTTRGIVIPVTNFWGRHSTDLWEWIRVKQNANGE